MTHSIATRLLGSAGKTRRHPISIRDLFALMRQRKSLAELDPHLLNDIGITEAEAHTEARRPVWDVPQHWRE